ncbi:MAG: hypothetical protein ACK502_03475 [Alphaproteobacteria bacterium]
MKRRQKLLPLGLCLMLATGCSEEFYDPKNNDKIDPNLSLSRDDYKNLTNAQAYEKPGAPGEMLNPAEPPIPALEEVLAAPSPPKIGATKLVSVAVTDDVPLKDVLVELARLADVDIEIDSGITGGVSFRAKDKPFNEVVERIADLAGLRYTMKNGVLRVERDTPYIQTYNIDFLNIDRDSNSTNSLSTNVFSAGGEGGGDGGGVGGGSSSSVNATSKSDFWVKFDEGVKAIMAYVPPSRVSAVTVASQPLSPENEGSSEGVVPASAAPAPVAATSTSDSFYVINRQAGAITISGTAKQHELIQKFLEKVRISTSAQVLIEAKIVEVTLNDQFQSGIDWSQFGGSKIGMPSTFGSVPDTGNRASFAFSLADIAGKNFDLQAAVDLTQTFGTTRTLSSPRLHAINNQQSVLTFAENIVYFELQIDRDTSTSTSGPSTQLEVTAEIKTVPIGIILSLMPSINTDTNEITLSVRPTLSRQTGSVSDPSVAFALAQLDPSVDTSGITNSIPVVEIRELDSILKLQSGEVMVIGGLMEDKSINTDRGIPWVSEVPYIGNAFKGVDKDHDVKELVIFIKATIVGTNGNAHPTDKAVYEKFTNDPRPLQF